jgi:HEAT repeat protein
METLVLHPDPRLKNLPLKGLKDKDLAVRHNAIRALGNMSAAAPVQELIAELNQPVRKQVKPAQAEDEAAPQTEAESIRIQEKADVIRALGAIGQPAAEALRQYLKRGAEAEMLEVTALLAFASSANRDDIPWVSTRLASDNKYVRAGALTVLGRIGNPEAQAAVMACAGDGDPLVRATAAKALGLIGTVYASKQLVAMLEDASPLVVSMAAWGLGKATYGEATAALKKVVKGRPASEPGPAKVGDVVAGPELAAVEALGKIGGAEAVAALVECLGSPSWRMRATAAQALGAAGDRSPAAMEALDKRLQDPNCLVRAQALLSLKALGRQFEAGYFQTK